MTSRPLNETQTRAELIDPVLKAAGWGVVDSSRVGREVIAPGRLIGAGRRRKQDIADYVLFYRGQKLGVRPTRWPLIPSGSDHLSPSNQNPNEESGDFGVYRGKFTQKWSLAMIRTAFLVIVLLTLAACQSDTEVPDNSANPAYLKIEIYSTGETPVDEVEEHIKALFPSGNVRALPNGRIAVAAPRQQQPSIGELIKQLSEAEPARQVRVRQWLIKATPSDQVAIPNNLTTLEEPLLDTVEVSGPAAFERIEMAEFQGLEGRRATVVGKAMQIRMWVRLEGNRIELRTETNTTPYGSLLETNISLVSGEPIVMGLVENADGDSMLLFVIEAEIL